MPIVSNIPPYPTNAPVYNRDAVMAAFNHPVRWKIIQTLCDEPMGAGGIAKVVGGNTSSVAKHMKVLMKAGICEYGKGWFYKMTPQFQPTPGAPRVLDFGHCIIRLDLPAPQ
jgi:hypothetical protein